MSKLQCSESNLQLQSAALLRYSAKLEFLLQQSSKDLASSKEAFNRKLHRLKRKCRRIGAFGNNGELVFDCEEEPIEGPEDIGMNWSRKGKKERWREDDEWVVRLMPDELDTEMTDGTEWEQIEQILSRRRDRNEENKFTQKIGIENKGDEKMMIEGEEENNARIKEGKKKEIGKEKGKQKNKEKKEKSKEKKEKENSKERKEKK